MSFTGAIPPYLRAFPSKRPNFQRHMSWSFLCSVS